LLPLLDTTVRSGTLSLGGINTVTWKIDNWSTLGAGDKIFSPQFIRPPR